MTRVVSDQVAEVGGTPCHVHDLRHRIPLASSQDDETNSSEDSSEELVVALYDPKEPRGEQILERSDEDARNLQLSLSIKIRRLTQCLVFEEFVFV